MPEFYETYAKKFNRLNRFGDTGRAFVLTGGVSVAMIVGRNRAEADVK